MSVADQPYLVILENMWFILLNSLPLIVDIGVGANWKEAHWFFHQGLNQMRSEVEAILPTRDHEYFDLSLSTRLLLITDGIVTELLEAMVREPIKLGYKNR